MSIQIICTACGAKYAVKDELAGKTAKCKCGAKIKISAPPLMPESFDHLFDELPPSADSSAFAPAASSLRNPLASAVSEEQATEALKKTAAKVTGYGGIYSVRHMIEGNGPAVGKVIGGAIVGGLLGLKALARRDDQPAPDPSWSTTVVVCAAAIGAVLASLLLVADAVRARQKERRRVPAVLRWFFGNGIWSLLLWIFMGVAAALTFMFIDIARL